MGAKIQKAQLWGANLQDANLEGASFTNAIERLSKVKTLFQAKLDPELKKQMKENYPHILEKPKSAMQRKKKLEDSKK